MIGGQTGVQVVPAGVQSELRYRNRRLFRHYVYALRSEYHHDDKAADCNGLWSTYAILRPIFGRRRSRLCRSLCRQDGITDRGLSFSAMLLYCGVMRYRYCHLIYDLE